MGVVHEVKNASREQCENLDGEYRTRRENLKIIREICEILKELIERTQPPPLKSCCPCLIMLTEPSGSSGFIDSMECIEFVRKPEKEKLNLLLLSRHLIDWEIKLVRRLCKRKFSKK